MAQRDREDRPAAEETLGDSALAGDVRLPEEASEIGTRGSPVREELLTDGPVMGGPGMMRTGVDRAVSTGTGGLAAGEDLDPVAEGDYWRENFRQQPYYEAEKEYSDYEPAYRYGWERAGLSEYRNRGFEEIELDLRRRWESSGDDEGRPSWEKVRAPARDAYERAQTGPEGRSGKSSGSESTRSEKPAAPPRK